MAVSSEDSVNTPQTALSQCDVMVHRRHPESAFHWPLPTTLWTQGGCTYSGTQGRTSNAHFCSTWSPSWCWSKSSLSKRVYFVWNPLIKYGWAFWVNDWLVLVCVLSYFMANWEAKAVLSVLQNESRHQWALPLSQEPWQCFIYAHKTASNASGHLSLLHPLLRYLPRYILSSVQRSHFSQVAPASIQSSSAPFVTILGLYQLLCSLLWLKPWHRL